MKFEKLELDGAFIIIPEKLNDERGYFTRSWDKEIFEKNKINSSISQCNISYNKKKGTVRGLHYQTNPFEEAKLVRCTNGKVFEVLLDLRRDSKTYLKWVGIEIDSKDLKMIFVPEGFALGFQTLEDDTTLFYQMSQIYKPEFARGVRYDDPILNIKWPIEVTNISEKDKDWKFLENNS
jgi:dTDP-4-dehydrorhamnose 3,5-epimerase